VQKLVTICFIIDAGQVQSARDVTMCGVANMFLLYRASEPSEHYIQLYSPYKNGSN